MSAGELISREEMGELVDVYIGHPLYCPCPTCQRVNEILSRVCARFDCRYPRVDDLHCRDHQQRKARR